MEQINEAVSTAWPAVVRAMQSKPDLGIEIPFENLGVIVSRQRMGEFVKALEKEIKEKFIITNLSFRIQGDQQSVVIVIE